MTTADTFDHRSKTLIDQTIKSVNDAWFPGAEYDPIAFARFDDELSRSLSSGSFSRVERACESFEAHMVRKLMSAKLGRHELSQRPQR